MAQEVIKEHSNNPSLSLVIVVKFTCAALVFQLLWMGYLHFSTSSKSGALSEIEAMISQQTSDAMKLEKAQVKEVLNAKKVVGTLQERQIKWSEVITLLLDATPDDIVFRSFSGNENASITMSAVASSFERISSLLDSLDKKSFVKRVFIPSVVKGTTPTNAAVYSFSLNIEYEK